jgi:alpha-tubulin suppressor-like RCC1 family protein
MVKDEVYSTSPMEIHVSESVRDVTCGPKSIAFITESGRVYGFGEGTYLGFSSRKLKPKCYDGLDRFQSYFFFIIIQITITIIIIIIIRFLHRIVFKVITILFCNNVRIIF